MRTDSVKSALRDVWYLVLLFAAIVAVVFYKLLAQDGDAQKEQRNVSPAQFVEPRQTVAQTQEISEPALEAQAPRPTEQEQTRDLVVEYQKRLDENPRDPDAPAVLNAMANLSKQKLMDYKAAAQYYELLITGYPDWEGSAKVYPQLATCYERMGDMSSRQDVYKRMMRKFPPESQEYLYAKSELGM